MPTKSLMADTTSNSSNSYKKRFDEYAEEYLDSFTPLPQKIPGAGGNPNAGSAKTVLNRNAKYNDKKTTQTVVGGQNGKK